MEKKEPAETGRQLSQSAPAGGEEDEEQNQQQQLRASGDARRTKIRVTTENIKSLRKPFLKHIMRNEAQKVKLLLHKGMPVDTADEDGMPAIHLAAQHGHTSCISLLLHYKADVNSREADTRGSPLHEAAKGGHSAVVKYLLSKGADVQSTDKYSRTPLMLCSSMGYRKVVKALLAAGADTSARDALHSTAAHYAAYGGHVEVIDLLLLANTSMCVVDKNGLTPFLHACAQGHAATARRLLADCGVDLKRLGVQRDSALHYAAYNKHYEVVKAILEHAKSELGDAYVKSLLDLRDKEGATPLHKAAFAGIGQIVEILLEYGAEINAVDSEGATPLHKAAFSAEAETVTILLAHGAAIDRLDNCGGTALFNACYSGSNACIVEFLKHPNIAEVINISDAEGRTPAKAAALNGHHGCVELIMAATCRLGIMTPTQATHVTTV